MVYKFLDKKSSGSGIKSENMSSKEISENYKNQLLENFSEKKSKLIFYRLYFGCWSWWYAVNK